MAQFLQLLLGGAPKIALLLRTGVISRIGEAVEVLLQADSIICVDEDGTPLARLEDFEVVGYSFCEEGIQSLRDMKLSARER